MASASPKPSVRMARRSITSMIWRPNWRRRMSWPFLPAQRILTVLPCPMRDSAASRARRAIEALKAPQRPRSAVQTTNRWTLSPPPPSSAGTWPLVAIEAARLAKTLSVRWAYGRADSAAVCARRSFAAATICMALVIFCVALTEAIRLRKSFSEGMVSPVHICPGAANSSEVLGVGIDNRFEFCPGLVGEILRGANRIEETGVARAQEREEPVLEGPHPVNRKRIEVAIDPGIDHANLFLHFQRRELRLFQKLGQARAAREQALGRRVEVGTELRERRHFTVLREFALDPARDLLHRLGLRRGADARDRKADVHGGPDALIEEIRLKKDLAIGDRDDIRRNISRNVVGLRFDHRKRRERAPAVGLVEFRRALEQPRMQIEYIARIGLASGRAAQQKRHLAIGDGLLGEIIVDDQRVHRVVAEIFAHRATGERRQKLHRRRIGRGRRDNDRIGQRALLFQYFHALRDGRAFLSDRDINAIELEVFVAALVQRLLIEDGIER